MKAVHGDKYDYSEAKYVSSQEDITIICREKDALGNEHGAFSRKPYSLLQGHGCPKCNGRNKTTELWIAEAKKVCPSGKYSFEKTVYKSARDFVTITCNEHGDFDIPARDFLSGHGCPKCNMPNLERMLFVELERENIDFVWQKKFNWLSGMSFDFFIEGDNVAIECQGLEHFIEKEFFDKRESLKDRVERDTRKKTLAKEHGITLVYFLDEKYTKYLESSDIFFTKKEELVEYLKQRVG